MSYTLKDVDEAEQLVRKLRPDLTVSRSDYDWQLAIVSPDRRGAYILFRCEDQNENGEIIQREITATPDEIEQLCFLMGEQWTPGQLAKIKAKR